MDFDFRDDEQQAADLARTILSDHATNERLKSLAAGGAPYDVDLWKALARAGLPGTAIPERFGGTDLGFLALGLVLREVGRTVAPVPVFPSLVLGALPLVEFGSDAQKNAWLPGVAMGERILTAALAEPASSDPLVPFTRVRRDGDGVRLEGLKTMVPYA